MNKNSENTLLLVSGDFSGIQDTVYTISSKGALKSLRARSFMLELLTEHIVYEILQLAEMKPAEMKPEDYLICRGKTETGVIYSGGGAFSLLLENNSELEEKIEAFADRLNCWAFYEFSGKLFIAINVLRVSDDDVNYKENFKKKRQIQTDESEKLKRRKFWTGYGALLEKILTPTMPVQTDNQKECQITRRDDLPIPIPELPKELNDWSNNDITDKLAPDFWVSKLSFHLWHLGDELTKLKEGEKIYRYDYEAVKEGLQDRLGYLCFPKIDDNYALYTTKKIGDTEEYWELGKDFFYAYYVKKVGELPDYAKEAERKVALEDSPVRKIKNDDTASFAGLAACSCGADLIGSLRMDVDNLGKLFSGIDDYKKLAELSHKLNYFFKVILNKICEGDFDNIKADFKDNDNELLLKDSELLKELPTSVFEKNDKKKRNVSIIYAGGDDLFIVGAWNEVVELAFDIQKCFAEYCKKNNIKKAKTDDYASISGGLTLHHPKFPLYQMAKRSGEAEHQAKSDDEEKNRIALFHDPIKKQRHSQLESDEKGDRYMLSMDWKIADGYLLKLMREFMKLGKIEDHKDKRNRFVIDKMSYQTIEKWFQVIEKYQQSGELYLPTMARVMLDLKSKLDNKLFSRLLECLYQKDNDKNMAHFHIALNWLSFLRRVR